MQFSVASRHFPDAEGTAAGRILYATCTGLLALGHEVDVCSWGPRPPDRELPPWSRWWPMPSEGRVETRLRALVRPRGESGRLGWAPAPGAIATADDPVSFAAVEKAPRSVITFHYATALDARAVGRISLRDVQDRRLERRAQRRSRVVLAYSRRVAETVDGAFVPAAYPVPAQVAEPVDEPIAAIVGDWRWPPNQLSLSWLLEVWRDVVERVPGARLLLAGWGLESVGPLQGVEVIGVPSRSAEVMARAAVMPFPCPPSSGPKVKVMEALSLGIPVVTTEFGVEGIELPRDAGAVVAARSEFAEAVARLLTDPERRARLGRSGREALLASHAPAPAAGERVAVITRVLAASRSGDAETRR